ncbi:hypothetical protein CWI37_1208p0010 [Hamiltosporidium tvaerminnensis]|uniref:Uncharacterized protein n=1 Tax=Hamiltosporidium tvaerminnensis TaxID=1176355 RepID=A0A4V2JUG9_9MICR|nr:hypothetical protein CWI37_1208p0010 [Hamiltosporidium tvaerminnensis]
MILFFLYYYRALFMLENNTNEKENFDLDLSLPKLKRENMNEYNTFFASISQSIDVVTANILTNYNRQVYHRNYFACYLIPLIHFNIVKSKYTVDKEHLECLIVFLEIMYFFKYKEYFGIINTVSNENYFRTSIHFFMEVSHLSEMIFNLYLHSDLRQRTCFFLHFKENIEDFKNTDLTAFDTIDKFIILMTKICEKIGLVSTNWSSIFDRDVEIIVCRIFSLVFNVVISKDFDAISFDEEFCTKVIEDSDKINDVIISYRKLDLTRSFNDYLAHISKISYDRLMAGFINLHPRIILNKHQHIVGINIREMKTEKAINIADTLKNFRDVINQPMHVCKNPIYEKFDLDIIEIICQSIYVNCHLLFCEIEYARVFGFCINKYKRLGYHYMKYSNGDQHTLTYNSTMVLCVEYCIYAEIRNINIFESDCLMFDNIDLLRNLIIDTMNQNSNQVTKLSPENFFPAFVTRNFLFFHYYSNCELIFQFCIEDTSSRIFIERGHFFRVNTIIIGYLLSFCQKEIFSEEFFRKNVQVILEIDNRIRSANLSQRG